MYSSAAKKTAVKSEKFEDDTEYKCLHSHFTRVPRNNQLCNWMRNRMKIYQHTTGCLVTHQDGLLCNGMAGYITGFQCNVMGNGAGGKKITYYIPSRRK